MNAKACASPEQIQQLGQSLLAASTTGGRVPAECLGLSLEANQVRRHPTSSETAAPSLGRLWWIYCGPLEVRFAPDSRAPEAGIAMRIQAHVPDGHLTDALAFWLDEFGSTVGKDAIVDEIRHHPALQLPPCVQHDELQQRCLELSRTLMSRGLRCTALAREDRYPEIDSRQAWEPETSHRTTPALPVDDDGDAIPLPATVAAALPDIESVITQDARLERRLFRELRPLSQHLRGCSLPEDAAQYATQRDLQRRIEHLAATAGRWPALENRINPIAKSPQRIRLLAEQSRHAAAALDEAWGLLGNDADSAPATTDLDALDRVITTLEIAIARRHTPDWLILT